MNDYCREYGHEHYSLPCKGCRSEALARGDDQPAEHVATALTPEQAERNLRGARAVLRALNANRTTTEEKP